MTKHRHARIRAHRYAMTSSNAEGAINWYEQCQAEAVSAIRGQIQRVPVDDAFNGVFYVFSYFFEKAVGAGIVTEDGGIVTPQSYGDAAREKACDQRSFDAADPSQCLDLCLLSAFLQEGYGFAGDKQLLTRKKIGGRETSWTLGATLAMLQ